MLSMNAATVTSKMKTASVRNATIATISQRTAASFVGNVLKPQRDSARHATQNMAKAPTVRNASLKSKATCSMTVGRTKATSVNGGRPTLDHN